MAQKAIDNYAQSANSVKILNEHFAKTYKKLGMDITDNSFKTTELGKVFAATSNYSKEFYDQLVKGTKSLGVSSQESVNFAKSLKSVHDHLSSIPPTMHTYGQAQQSLGSATSMTTLANHLLNGSIEAIDGGYKRVVGSTAKALTVMDDFGVNLTKLKNQNDSYVGAMKKFSETQLKSGEQWDGITKRANDYSKAVSEVQSMQRILTESIKDSGKTFTDHNGKVLTASELEKNLSKEKGIVTSELNKQESIYKALTKEIDANTNGVVKHLLANHSDLLSVQELGKEYYGLNKAVRQVSEYGTSYVEALNQRTKGHETNRAAIEYNAEAVTKYAKTAESLITQNRNIADSLIEVAKGNEKYKNDQQGLIDYTQKINDETKKFENTLRDQKTILDSTTSANKNTANAVLNYVESQGVAKDVTDRVRSGIYELLPPMKGYEDKIKELNTQIKNQSMNNIEAKESLDKEIKKREEAAQKVKEEAEARKKANQIKNDELSITQRLIIKVKELAMYYASAALLYGLTTAVRTAVTAMADFDQTLHSLKAITGATNTEIAVLGDVMQEVSRNSRYSLAEVGEGLQLMGQAGLDAVQSMNAIKAATDLAVGTLEKMDPVVDLLTTTMTAFYENMDEASLNSTKIADIFAVAINKSKLSVDKLRTAFNYLGLTAAQTGLSLEETNATLMIMADAGMKASTMGTSMRQVLSRLIAPNQKLREAYEESGVSLSKINPLTAGYESALQGLVGVLWDNQKGVVDSAKAYELFGLRGAQAAIAIVRAFKSGDYHEAMEALKEPGMASEMAAEQMEGLTAKFENLIARLKDFAVLLGEAGITNTLKALIDMVSGTIEVFRVLLSIDLGGYFSIAVVSVLGFMSAFKSLGAIVSFFTASQLGLLFSSLSSLPGIINKISYAFALLSTAMMAHPIIAIISAIVTLTLAVKMWIGNTEEANKKLSEQALKTQIAADSIEVFIQALDKVDETGKDYNKLLRQFGENNEEVEKRVLDLTGASTLATLSIDDLKNALEKVKMDMLVESMELAVKALNGLDASSKNSVDSYGNATKEAKKYENAMRDLVAVAYKFQQSTGYSVEGIRQFLELMGASPETINQVILSVDKLIEKNKMAGESYKELQQSGLESYRKIYQGLTVAQKLEMIELQKQKEARLALLRKQYEEELITKIELIAAEQLVESEYYMKALEKRTDFVKKELEIESERLNREQALINAKKNYLFSALQNNIILQQKYQDQLEEQRNKADSKELAELEIHMAANRAIIQQTQKQLADLAIYEKRRSFQEKQKVDQAYLDFYKAQLDLEVTATTINESDKIKARIYSSQLDLDSIRKKKDEFVKIYKAEGAEYQKILSEELKARKQVLESQMELIDHYLEQIKSKYDTILTSISKNYELETEIVQRSLDLQLEALESQYATKEALLESSYVKRGKYYELEVGNESELQKKKIALHLEYLNKTMNIQEEGLNKNLELIERERVETAKAIEDKYSAQLNYEDKILSLKASSVSSNENVIYKETSLTISELKEMGASWFNYGEKIYQVMDDTANKVVETAKAESTTVEEKNKEIVENEIKAYAARKAELEKYFNEVKSKLQEEEGLYRELLGKRGELAKSSNDLEKQYFDDQRTTRQLSMSDYQKYRDDLARINELYNEGVRKGDKELLDQARDMMASYSSEQKDSAGNVGASLTEVANTRSAMFTKIYEAQKTIIDKEKADNEEAINKIKAKIDELKKEVESYGAKLAEVTAQEFKLNSEQAEKAIKDIHTKVDDLKKVLNDLKMVIDIAPFVRQIQSIETELTKFVTDANQKKVEVPMSLVGGTEKKAVETYMEDVKTFVSKKAEEIKAIKIEIESEVFTNFGGEDRKTFNEGMTALTTKVEALNTSIANTPVDLNVNVKGHDGETEYQAITLLNYLKEKVDALQSEDFTYNIFVNGLETLIEAVNYQNQLQDKTVTHTITTVHKTVVEGSSTGGEVGTPSDSGSRAVTSVRGRWGGLIQSIRKFAEGGFTGQLRGYGGGDIVPALLEPGEFVIRKEAVKKYGTSFFKKLNGMKASDFFAEFLNTKTFNFGGAVLPGSKTSGYYPTQQTVNQGSAQTYTVEFKVGNDSYQLKGEGNVVQRMVANMRRSRLVTV
jgi:TP901 family phage tail tape measure protein